MPHASFYAPIYPFSSALPAPYTVGSLFAFSRDSAWWSVTAVGNYMERMYMYIVQDVKAAQKAVEEEQLAAAPIVEAEVAQLIRIGDLQGAKKHLTQFQVDNANKHVAVWFNLWESLICKYHDGYRLMNYHSQSFVSDTLFYPLTWLQSVGFFVTPPDFNATSWTYTVDPALSTHPRTAVVATNAEHGRRSGKHAGTGYPNPSIQFADEQGVSGLQQQQQQHASAAWTLAMATLLCGVVVSPIAVIVGRKMAMQQMQHQYQPVAQQ